MKLAHLIFRLSVLSLIAAVALASPVLFADESSDEQEELAKKLANPIASLISLPIQLNYDSDIGVQDTGDRFLLNVQPVIPFSMSENWNVISRTILPVIYQDDIYGGGVGGAGSQFGVGDIVQSLFFSPKKPTSGGLVWGVGPVFLVPTATDDLLGAKKWGLGPTAVALKQAGPWTIGGLVNHIESVAGSDGRGDISSTFIQPFFAYTTPTAWTYTLQTESTYNWEAEQWSVPINGIVSKVVKVGPQLLSVGGGLRYWADSPESGAEGLGFRFMVTFLFPK